MNLMETVSKAGTFTTFKDAINAAGLNATLDEAGPFTVFAPTDDAFAKLPAGRLEGLMKPENKSQLAAILNYHVVRGSLTSAEVGKMSEAKTLQGQMLPISSKQGVQVHGANITAKDVKASNGMIHTIDAVLLP